MSINNNNNKKKSGKKNKTKAFKSKAAGYFYVSYRFSQKQHNPACKSETCKVIRNRDICNTFNKPTAIQ